MVMHRDKQSCTAALDISVRNSFWHPVELYTLRGCQETAPEMSANDDCIFLI
jgi:hypothetical protein